MTDRWRVIQTEIAAAAVLAAAALFSLLWLIPNHTQIAHSDNDVSPAFFPILAAATVLVLSLAMVVVRLTRGVGTSLDLSGLSVLRELVVWSVAAVTVYILMPIVGFIPTSVSIIAMGGLAAGARQWLVLALLAVGFSIAVDWGAWRIFAVDLP